MESILILFVMLILSGFFSGAETALTTITKSRVESLFKDRKRGSIHLLKLKNDTNRMLIAILIGNNLVNIGASSIATIMATEHFGHLGPGLAVGGLTIFILIFGEITPKTFAARHSAPIALFVAPFIEYFARIFFPLAWILGKLTSWLQSLSKAKHDPIVTESELISLASHGAAEGSIEEDEKLMIRQVFALDYLKASNIMIPRNRIVSMNGNLTLQEVLGDLIAQPHSRIPLHSGDPEGVSKVLYLREALSELVKGNLDKTLFECGHDPIFVPLNQPIDTLLYRLRQDKRKLILVVDASGTLQGLFTIEDILEELVGEIREKHEKLPTQIVETEEGEFLIPGNTELRFLESFLKRPLPGNQTDSVSKWIIHNIAYIPATDECFELDDLKVCIVKASAREIIEVRIKPL
ncbi:MAG: HlyC/CorC family transporter [Magnetococcales bacterium]|nr:HlyC/CorC family transporter [Magnetococcales bacterium]